METGFHFGGWGSGYEYDLKLDYGNGKICKNTKNY